MLEYLFSIFDIPIVTIYAILTLFGLLFIKNINNLFLVLFTNIFLIIFIATTMLTQQIYLGEFLVVSIFFILTVTFFIFNIDNIHTENEIDDNYYKLKVFCAIIIFFLAFSIIGLNFFKINFDKSNMLIRNVTVSDELNIIDKNNYKDFDSYAENILLLNQNKIFQKLTHIVMLYICLVIVFYFFNKKEDNER